MDIFKKKDNEKIKTEEKPKLTAVLQFYQEYCWLQNQHGQQEQHEHCLQPDEYGGEQGRILRGLQAS